MSNHDWLKAHRELQAIRAAGPVPKKRRRTKKRKGAKLDRQARSEYVAERYEKLSRLPDPQQERDAGAEG